MVFSAYGHATICAPGMCMAILVGEPEIQKLEKSGRKVAEF